MLSAESWNSGIVDVVPRDELPQAITAIGISYNSARALGPALAGYVYALGGAGWVFVLTVLGVAALFESRAPEPAAAAPAVTPAGRAPVGRHAERAALRAPFRDRAGAAGARHRVQRGRLGAVGTAARHRPAPARAWGPPASAC